MSSSVWQCRALAPRRTRSQATGLTVLPKLRRRKRRTQTVNVTAFKAPDEPISLHMDGFNLLQVNRAASRETCSKKYDSLVNNPPKVGYTQETLYSRAVVLKSVTEAVMDMTATPSYKQQPGHMSVNLMYSNLPGALALLQEAGETQTVLDWGCAWLRDSVSDSKTRDVALSMALTHCNAAAMLLEEDPDNALLAVEAMTAALKLLRDHGPHPQLEVDISGAMKELSPKVALQQLSLPTDDLRRREGLSALRGFVWDADRTQLQRPRTEYMRDVRDQMTALEQIELFEAQPKGSSIPAEDTYDTALAYVAEGYRCRKPQHVQTAHRLLTQVAQQPQANSDLDVSVELAVCSLLLGDTIQAEDALRLGPNNAADDADPAVRSFVMDACVGSGDLLPGLCALAQQWLRDVALPGFRDMPAHSASLTDWYSDKRVSLYLQMLDNSQRLRLDNAASATKQYLSGVFNSMLTAVTRPFASDQHSPKPKPSAPALERTAAQPNAKPARGAPLLPSPTAQQAVKARREAAAPSSNGARQSTMPDRQAALTLQPERSLQRPAAPETVAAQPVAAQAHQARTVSAHEQQAGTVAARAQQAGSVSAQAQQARPDRATFGGLTGEPAEPVIPQHDSASWDVAALNQAERSGADTAGGHAEASSAADGRLQPSDAIALPDDAMSPLSRPKSTRPRSPDRGSIGVQPGGLRFTEGPQYRSSMGITDGIVQFEGEREMWASFQDSDLRAKRRLRALVVGLALVVAGLAFKTYQHSSAAQSLSAVPTAMNTPLQATSPPMQQTAGPLTDSNAKQLLLQWNEVKAAAMGPQHDIEALSSVLAGDMLVSWQEQAESLQAEGRHWDYDIASMEILSVEADVDDSAIVLAVIQETATLCEAARLQHVYESRYLAEYELRQDGSDWKLMQSTVTLQ